MSRELPFNNGGHGEGSNNLWEVAFPRQKYYTVGQIK